MTVSLKHKFQSAKADGVDTTVVQPSNWNAEHDLTCATDRVLGRVTAGAGSVEEIPCTATGRSLIAAADVAAVNALLGTASVPSGSITAFAGSSAPADWLACDGSAVSRTTYAALFAAIGTAWGVGNGSTTFNLPDLRGAFLRGSGAGLNPVSRSVGSYQADDVKPHTHGVTDPGHTHSYLGSSFSNGAYSSGGRADTQQTNTTASATTGITINNSTGVETVPKNYAVLYIIKT